MWKIMKPATSCTHAKTCVMNILDCCINELKISTHLPQMFNNASKYIHTTATTFNKPAPKPETSQLALFSGSKEKKGKSEFLDILHEYVKENRRHTRHATFIYSALRYMDEFGVNQDLEVYKAILDTMPKGKFVATSVLLAEFFHHPRETQCMIDLLQKMENNGVIPDPETETMMINILGSHSYAVRKLRRMAYWQTKFKNLNPWPFPRPVPTDSLELGTLAIQRIVSIDVQSTITEFDTKNVKDSIDKTWIVSGSSPDQEKLISQHPINTAMHVEGPYKIWVSKACVDYFILCADSRKRPCEEIDDDDILGIETSLWKKAKKNLIHYRSIHEQDEQTIFGVCATGTSSKDSLLSWIRCLQERNPALISIPILFKFTGPVDDYQTIDEGKVEENSVETLEFNTEEDKS